MSPGLVLVVDDNPDNVKLLLRFLGAKGFTVRGATSIAEAEAVIAGDAPSIVLVDVSLPGEDGMSWVQRIRERAPGTEFVAFTAHTSPQMRERALAAGCVECIIKPVPLKELQQFLAARLGAAGS